MLPQYTRKSNRFVAIGLCLHGAALGIVLVGLHAFLELAGILLLAGICLLIYGGGMYMQAKGYSRNWRFLMFFGALGLIVMFCFPDRHTDASEITPRKQGWALLSGGCAGMVVAGLPALLSLFSNEESRRNGPHGVDMVVACGLILGGCFLVGSLAGLVLQSIIYMLKPAPKAACENRAMDPGSA